MKKSVFTKVYIGQLECAAKKIAKENVRLRKMLQDLVDDCDGDEIMLAPRRSVWDRAAEYLDSDKSPRKERS